MRFSVANRHMAAAARRVLGITLAAALVAGSFPAVAFADPQSELEAARAQLEQIGSEYNALQSQLDEAGRNLEETKGEIEENEKAIADKQDELEDAQTALAERVSASYKSGNANLLEVVLGATDFNDLLSRVFYADKVVDADKQAIDNVKRIQDELDQKQTELENRQEEQQQLVDDTNAQLSELASKQQAASDLVNSLDAEVQRELAAEAEDNESLSGAIQAADDAETNDNDGGASISVPADEDKYAEEDEGSDDNGSSSNGGSSNGGSSSGGSSLPEATGGSPISIALQYQGAPYVYGGASPSAGGFDCSGLVQYAYKKAYGITLPHSASAQASYIKANGFWTTDVSKLSYGDLVFFSGHVAFYVGNGQCYGARRPGVGASTTAMKYFPGFYGGGHL